VLLFCMLVDMPLEQLRTYTGRNPRPDDLEDYWSRALEELEATPADPELVHSSFTAPQAECYDLFFTGVGGARIHAKLLKPVGRTGPVPAVLHFHGYSFRAGDWSEYLRWAGAGFVTAALDCRGQAGESEDTGGVRGDTRHGHIVRGLLEGEEKLLYRSIFLDTVRLAHMVMEMEEVDQSRVGATGGSQGGGLALACASLEPRIKRCAPVYPFLSDYQRVWEMDLAQRAYEELQTFFRHFDPTHENEDEYFRRLGYIDVHNLSDRIQAQTLMLTGLMDTVCPPSTQFAAYNAITAPKDMVIYPDFRHENLPGSQDTIFTFMMGL
jgi:cephalosporin-C deacetylase